MRASPPASDTAAQKWSWQRGAGAASLEGVAPRDVRPAWANACRAHTADATADENGDDAADADETADAAAPAASGCQCLGAEPTEDEYAGALAEATQALQAAVTGVNEALEELREAAHDLREGA